MLQKMNINLNIGANPYEFPRVAKEMGFRFSLKRGRVDWHKIDVIDIDHLIQERDLTTLKDNLINIMNYNLESEYDVKILDRSFVKLFKLAQLSIDYLMYSEQHLFNCVELIREEYATCVKDNERLKRTIQKKDNVTKNLKKRIQEKGKMKMSNNQLNKHQDIGFHKCAHCPKVFLSAWYLEAHCTRRHVEPPAETAPGPAPGAARVLQDVAALHAEIQQLKTLLTQPAPTLHAPPDDPANKENVPVNTSIVRRDSTSTTQTLPETDKTLEKIEELEQKYMENIVIVKNTCLQDIKMAAVLGGVAWSARRVP